MEALVQQAKGLVLVLLKATQDLVWVIDNNADNIYLFANEK